MNDFQRRLNLEAQRAAMDVAAVHMDRARQGVAAVFAAAQLTEEEQRESERGDYS